MKIRNILFISAAVLFSTASMSGQSRHTWVSLNGNDGNPCSATSPCLTFAGALSKTTAGGLITALDAGDFGAVTINQSVTIDGNNIGSITFNATAPGISITGGANVTLQNLTINGNGAGYVGINDQLGSGSVTVDNCKIMNFDEIGINYTGAGTLTVENSRIEALIGVDIWGIALYPSGKMDIVVKNTVIDASPVSNTNNGFAIRSSGGTIKASLQNVTIEGAGSAAVYSETGVTEITGSVITQSGYGVDATSGATISVASSLITANSTGVCSQASSKIRLDNNDIYDNTTAIANCGGIVKTSTTNKTSGTISIPASDVSESVTF